MADRSSRGCRRLQGLAAAPGRKTRPGFLSQRKRHDVGESRTISADLAFQHCANAAAAVYGQAPPWVTYRVNTHVTAPSLGKSREVVRGVAVRTRDDAATIQDLPRGENQFGHSFPVSPVFDALSYFVFSWQVSWHQKLTAYVHDIKPLQYEDLASKSSADVVVISLRSYRATYAGDSSDAPDGRTHLKLVPYDFLKKIGNPDRTFYYSDLWIDNATDLPSSVRFEGADDKVFVVDSKMIEGHWLVGHIHYEETLHGPLRIGSLHVVADADYDTFTFPQTAPDPRLTPLPGTPEIIAPAAPQASPSPAASP